MRVLTLRPSGCQFWRHDLWAGNAMKKLCADPRQAYNTQDRYQDLLACKEPVALCVQAVVTVAVMISHGDPRFAFALHRENRKKENYDNLFKSASPTPSGQVKRQLNLGNRLAV